MKVFQRHPANRSQADGSLIDEFKDAESGEEYRYAYAEEHLNTMIALQIRAIREQRNMKQSDLAERIGTQQPGIARLENVNSANWKTDTLKRVARALGVRLRISFETFGTLLDEDADFNQEALRRPGFEDDPVFAAHMDTEQAIEVDERTLKGLQGLVKKSTQEVPNIEDFIRGKESEKKLARLGQGDKKRGSAGR